MVVINYHPIKSRVMFIYTFKKNLLKNPAKIYNKKTKKAKTKTNNLIDRNMSTIKRRGSTMLDYLVMTTFHDPTFVEIHQRMWK